MEILIGGLLGLAILMVLVALHELGHAMAAIKSGVIVEEFGLGFPPRASARKLKNGILFTLNWLPLGGFVKFQGEYDAADKKGDYGSATYLQKTAILFAGVTMNWITAAVILTILACTSGIPQLLPNQFFIQSDATVVNHPVEVIGVVEGSPAEKAGIKEGDMIREFAGDEITSPAQIIELSREYQGQAVEVVFDRDGAEERVNAQINNDEAAADNAYFGTSLAQRPSKITSSWSAPVTGVVTTAQFSWQTLVGVKDLAANAVKGVVMRVSPNAETREQGKENLGSAASSVAGPVGILGVIFPAAMQGGIADILFLTAIISLTLAVMNILPIPALDGGRWLIMTAFRIIHEPLTKEREETIQSAGFVVLLSLIVVVTFADIGKIL